MKRLIQETIMAKEYINKDNPVYFSYASNNDEHPHIADVTDQLCKRLAEEGLLYHISKEHVKCGSINDFEIEIGYARCIIIVYNKKYFRSEHCMNEYAKIVETTKDETTRKIVLINSDGISLNDETIKEIIDYWNEVETNRSQYHDTITQQTIDHQYYNKPETSFSIQNIKNFFSKYSRKKTNEHHILDESVLNEVIRDIINYYKDNCSNTKAPSFTFPVPDGLMHREKEAEELYNLVSQNRIVNLVGVGGSGKSSLAYLCMDKYHKNFNEIAYAVVNNNIKNDIVDQLNETLQLEFDKDAYTELITYLQENYKSEKPNLLVLDINETADYDKNNEFVNEIIKNSKYLQGWNFLILSRESIDTRKRIMTHNINDIENIVFLKELFLAKAGDRYTNFGDFEGLFKMLYYNPLLAEQLGLYLNDYPTTATLDDIRYILGESLKEEEMQGMSAQRHDEDIMSFLNNLIVFEKLEDNEKQLLRHFVLWHTDYIRYDVIADLLKGILASDAVLIKALKSLSRRSIITTNNNKTLSYKLHGLLAYSLRKQIDIENEDYNEYLNNIDRIIKYGYYQLVPFVDCIGNSLCKYNISTDYVLMGNTANIFREICASNYAHILYTKCIDIIKNSKTPINLFRKNDLAGTYINLAILHENCFNEYNFAKTNYKIAIDICKELPKNNIVFQNNLANAYNCLANLQMNYLNEYKEAESNYLKSITILKYLPKNILDYQNSLAGTFMNLANLQQEYLNKYQLAETNYKNAIEILIPIKDHKYQYQLAKLYTNFANFQINCLFNYDSAILLYKQAIKICEGLSKDIPAHQKQLSEVYHNFAILQENHLKNYKLAELFYKKAIEICTLLPTNNLEYQKGLASLLNDIANLQQLHLNEFKTAELNYLQVIKIEEKLPKSNPIYLNNLACTYNNIAILQNNHLNDFLSAELNYKKTIEIRKSLSNNNPKIQNDLAISYNNYANLLHKKLKNYRLSEYYYQKAIEILEGLSNTSYKNLECAYNNYSALLKDENRLSESETYKIKAYQIWQKIEMKKTDTEIQ